MEKTIKIEGMACMHCAASVKKALEEVAGVQSVTVDLENKCAVVTLNGEIADCALASAITAIGFEVLGVE